MTPSREEDVMAVTKEFLVKLTGDFFLNDGKMRYEDIGLSVLEGEEGISWRAFDEHRPEIGSDQVGDAQGVLVLTPKTTAETVSKSENLLVVARFGVGYDSVDLEACNDADVAVVNTPGTVDRPVAEATVGWMIALCHNMTIKDHLVRTGQWDTRSQFMGIEVRDRTLGVIGCGGIAGKVIELLGSFGMNQPLAYDPYLDEAEVASCGARKVSLTELLSESDFVSIHCPLTDETRGLIGKEELAKMTSNAYLINTARGGIVDEDALFEALKNYSLAGAALDCFEGEPITEPHPLGELDNVLLAPHCIAWTHELFRDIGRTAFQAVVDLAHGIQPNCVVNPEVFDSKSFQEKWNRLKLR